MALGRALLVLLGVAACRPGPEAAIALFTVNPSAIGAGEDAQLEWRTAHAAECAIFPEIGIVAPVGARRVIPARTTTYTLSCGKAVARVELTVNHAVKVDSFTASPSKVSPGSAVTLAWAARDATSCVITEVGTVAPTGATTVFPSTTTTWRFTCEGFSGPAFALATTEVVAGFLAPPTEPTATAGDGKLTLSWKQPAGTTNVYFARMTGVNKATVATLPDGQIYSNVTAPFDVPGLVNGVRYFFVVRTVLGTVESGDSVEASGAPDGGVARGDPYFANQWHLSNVGQRGGTAGEDIQVTQTWAQGYHGEGVRVAIVDDGVDFKHEDLSANVSVALSHDYLGNAPLSYAEHGTCVAGLVAARDENGVGMRGVAPRSNLVSYNLLQDLTVANELDAMVRGKQTNAVSSNSWGDADDGTGLFTFAELPWLQGVTEGTQTGRSGLGTVYVWASGNGADGLRVDNSNYDGQANSRFVFAIGGVGDDGRKASYSEEGANLLVVAPTMGRANHGLSTTDLTGTLGYNAGSAVDDTPNASYTNLMDGTSGSTPIVAGIAALVLQVKPQLTWRDVRRVLAYSARRNDPMEPGWATNLAGLAVNHKYGFGVADASAAVRVANGFSAGAPELSFATALTSPAAAIPDDNSTGVSSAIVVSGSAVGHLEFIEVTVTVSHPRSGDLEILLERESGPDDVLAVPHRCAPQGGVEQCSPIQGWVFGTVRHLDEPADGTWTLRVKDRQSGNTGTLQAWKLTFWGRP